jgi:putative transposase
LIDQLIAEHGYRPEDIAGETGLLKQLTKALLERAMQAEMTNHLGYEKHAVSSILAVVVHLKITPLMGHRRH